MKSFLVSYRWLWNLLLLGLASLWVWLYLPHATNRRPVAEDAKPKQCQMLRPSYYRIHPGTTESDLHLIERGIRLMIFASVNGDSMATTHLQRIRGMRGKDLLSNGVSRDRYAPQLEALENCPNREVNLSHEESSALDDVYKILERGPYVLRSRAAQLMTQFDSPRAIHALKQYILTYAADSDLEIYAKILGEMNSENALNALITIGRHEHDPMLFRWAAMTGFFSLSNEDLSDRAKIEVATYWEILRKHPLKTLIEWALLENVENFLEQYHRLTREQKSMNLAVMTPLQLAQAIVIGHINFSKGSPHRDMGPSIAEKLLSALSQEPSEIKRRWMFKALERMSADQVNLNHSIPTVVHHLQQESSALIRKRLIDWLSIMQHSEEFLTTLENFINSSQNQETRAQVMQELALRMRYTVEGKALEVRAEIVKRMRAVLDTELKNAEVHSQMSQAIKDYDAFMHQSGRR